MLLSTSISLRTPKLIFIVLVDLVDLDILVSQSTSSAGKIASTCIISSVNLGQRLPQFPKLSRKISMSTKLPKTFHVPYPISKPTPVRHQDQDVISNNPRSTLEIRELVVNIIIIIMDVRVAQVKTRVKDKGKYKDKDQDRTKVSVKTIPGAEVDLVVVEEVVKDHDRTVTTTQEEAEARVLHQLNRLVYQPCYT